jgi:hypothetical protein
MYDAKPKTTKIIPRDLSHFVLVYKKEIHANFYYILEKNGDFILFFKNEVLYLLIIKNFVLGILFYLP